MRTYAFIYIYRSLCIYDFKIVLNQPVSTYIDREDGGHQIKGEPQREKPQERRQERREARAPEDEEREERGNRVLAAIRRHRKHHRGTEDAGPGKFR